MPLGHSYFKHTSKKSQWSCLLAAFFFCATARSASLIHLEVNDRADGGYQQQAHEQFLHLLLLSYQDLLGFYRHYLSTAHLSRLPIPAYHPSASAFPVSTFSVSALSSSRFPSFHLPCFPVPTFSVFQYPLFQLPLFTRYCPFAESNSSR